MHNRVFAVLVALFLGIVIPHIACATVGSQNSSITVAGNGVTTTFNYNFLIPAESPTPVNVYLLDQTVSPNTTTLLAPGTYTITGLGNSLGGTVVYPLVGSPIGTGKFLIISRDVPYTQTVAFSNQGIIYPSAIELGLDTLELQIQQLTPQAFVPGGGTITGVTAGAGLNGGGTSGIVTLAVNTNLSPIASITAPANLALIPGNGANNTDAVTFGAGADFQIAMCSFHACFRGLGSGNPLEIQNISGASSYDSAISFNDGQTTQHGGDGIEHGAIGWHQGSQFPFDNSMFIEVSNDPESGSTTNPPSLFNIIQTGYLNGSYASRKRFTMKTDGSMGFFDASSIGFSDGVQVMTIPDLAATGIGMNILSVGGSGTPQKSASFMAVGLTGAGTNAFATSYFGASDTALNNLSFMAMHGTRTTDTTYKLFDYADTDGAGTTLWRVLADGDSYNYHGIWSMLSDEREKTKYGAMPATSEILRKIEFGRFRYKADEASAGGAAQFRFGPYAQQLLQILPDEFGQFLISEVEADAAGTKRYSLNTSGLGMLTSKALQETIERLDRDERVIAILALILAFSLLTQGLLTLHVLRRRGQR